MNKFKVGQKVKVAESVGALHVLGKDIGKIGIIQKINEDGWSKIYFDDFKSEYIMHCVHLEPVEDKFELQVGKTYVTRDGQHEYEIICDLKSKFPNHKYDFIGVNVSTGLPELFMKNGSFNNDGEMISADDLIMLKDK